MRSTIISTLLALAAASSVSAHLASGLDQHVKRDVLAAPPARSRHATRQVKQLSPVSSLKQKKRSSKKCKAKTVKVTNASGSTLTGSTSSTTTTSDDSDSTDDSSTSSSSDSSSSSGSGVGWTDAAGYLKVGDVYVGFLPDDGSGGGSSETMAQINSVLPAKSAWYGRYAQVTSGNTFDGNQLYHVLDDVKSSGGILAASVMPYKTWDGLTEGDNRNAIAIAKVCNDIYQNHGVEVWLRFAHEMNWYCTDGTYSGGYDSCVNSFQTAWKLVAAAVKEHAPETKMWWSPNVGSDNDYDKCYPKEGQVDVVGFDWYPTSASDSFVEKAKPFHDKYATGDTVMVQGETGLHYTGTTDEKMAWVKSLSSSEAQSQMKNYLGWMWFNYDKYENGQQIDFKIVEPGQGTSSGVNAAAVSFFSA